MTPSRPPKGWQFFVRSILHLEDCFNTLLVGPVALGNNPKCWVSMGTRTISWYRAVFGHKISSRGTDIDVSLADWCFSRSVGIELAPAVTVGTTSAGWIKSLDADCTVSATQLYFSTSTHSSYYGANIDLGAFGITVVLEVGNTRKSSSQVPVYFLAKGCTVQVFIPLLAGLHPVAGEEGIAFPPSRFMMYAKASSDDTAKHF